MSQRQTALTRNQTNSVKLPSHAHTLRCSFCFNIYKAKAALSLSEARCPACSRKFKYIAALRRLRHWWRAHHPQPELEL